MLNDERAELILVFDNDHPAGYIAGARFDYRDGETETVAKALTELQAGDQIDFLCDYYGYDGSYLDSYKLGDQLVVSGTLQVSDTYVGQKMVGLYKITDIYGQSYWTEKFNK